MNSRKIEIELPFDMEIPDDLIYEIDNALAKNLCEPYKRSNPDRTMWVGGFGAKPSFSYRDAMFLGKQNYDESIPDGAEPTFDQSIYHIEVMERSK
jgi:hypothetical protein